MRRRRKQILTTQTPKKPPRAKISTLCWCCAKATTGGCSWSANFVPVEGWEATPTIIKEGLLTPSETGKYYRESHSYRVHSCPEFVEDVKPHLLNVPRIQLNLLNNT